MKYSSAAVLDHILIPFDPITCIKTIKLNRLLYSISNWLFISFQISPSQYQFVSIFTILSHPQFSVLVHLIQFFTTRPMNLHPIRPELVPSTEKLNAKIPTQGFIEGNCFNSLKTLIHCFRQKYTNYNYFVVWMSMTWWIRKHKHLNLNCAKQNQRQSFAPLSKNLILTTRTCCHIQTGK